MDGTLAINNNLNALKRILASLVAMAGLANTLTSPLWGGRREASGGGRDAEDTPTRWSDDHRPPPVPVFWGEVGSGPTLPRHLRLAILRLLRPAESAARRLIIAAARGLTVTLPPARPSRPKPISPEPMLRRFGIAVTLPTSDHVAIRATRTTLPHPEVRASGEPRIALPLFDPLKRPFRAARRTVPPHAAPRILFPGIAAPHRLPPPPSPDDPVDATRLNLRLAALAAALGDIEGQARRFARLQARRRQAGREQSPSPLWGGVRGGGNLRTRRIWPLRPGRPPGGRLARYDPSTLHPRRVREVDEILAHAHSLALVALQRPDTS